MTLQDVMETIEGHRFAAEVNLAAGFEAFSGGIQNHLLFRDLADRMKDQSVLKIALRRLSELARKPIRMQYENPSDSAMAAYLMAVQRVDPEVAAVAAEAISKTPNCWWASQVSSRIAASASLRRLGVPSAPLARSAMRNMVAGGEIDRAPHAMLKPAKQVNGRGCHHTRKRRAGKRAA